jgi:hypothetical protein
MKTDLLTIDDWIVCWTPNRPRSIAEQVPGAILVARLGDEVYWSHQYAYVTGCCETARHSMRLWKKIALMFIDFHKVVVRDGVDPQAAHREFLKIDEYCRRISPDTPGALASADA